MALENLGKKFISYNQVPVTAGRRNPKRIIIVLIFLAVFLIPTIFTIYSARNLGNSLKKVNFALKSENLDLISESIAETKVNAKNLNLGLSAFFYLRVIPILGGYYFDAYGFSSALNYSLEGLEKIINELKPFKAELGLAGSPTPGQDKVAQAVKILNKTIPYLESIEPDLKKSREAVEGIYTEKYPENFRQISLRKWITEAKELLIGAHLAVSENKELIKSLPAALGSSGTKTYLLLFQNDKEIRATGGFITAFAFIKFENGHIQTSDSNDIYQLDEKLLNVCKNKICPLSPPEPIVKYLPEFSGKPRTAWSMRDSNLSPDLKTSLEEFKRMYQLLGEGLPFDGIITIDTKVVEELIKITGPIDVLGITYFAQKDGRCDCPGVIYELEHYAEVASKGDEDRKAVLGTLMSQILVKVLGSGSDKLLEIISSGVKLANEKHLMYYLDDQNLQASLARLNWTGEIKKIKGDYLHINDSNFAGGKSNLYVEELITKDLQVAQDGSLKVRLEIEYKNPFPFNKWLNGILRDFVRIYVPKGSTLVNSKGSDDPIKTKEDEKLDKTYFEAFVTVRPQNSRILSFEYTLPFKADDKYQLLIQKQPGAKDHKYIIKVNGKVREEFNLTTDREINLDF